MKFFIRTFGCQMNVNESEIMSGLLEDNGFEWTENPLEADVILVNSCAVREKAENKMFGIIGEYGKIKKTKKNLIIGVGGCSAEKNGKDILKRFDKVNFVFGTRNVIDIVNMINRAKKKERFVDFTDRLDEVSATLPKVPKSAHHAWVTIIYGCNKYCTYCIVPYTRGLEKSRPINDIVKEIENYSKNNYREITFLGQNVDSYGKDFGDKKPKLDILFKEAAKFDSIERLWFLTSYPSDITDSLIKTIKEEPKAAKYFHLPIQSGSNRILKSMNRKYTREQFLELTKKIYKEIPHVSTSSDIIVGFPGETEEDYQDTVEMIKLCRFEKINIAEYSPREGTVAYKYKKDDVPKSVKNERLRNLMDIQKNINREINNHYLNKVVRVIQECTTKDGIHYGRTINNKMVMFKSEDVYNGKFMDIKIRKVSAGPLYGEVYKKETDHDFDKHNDPTFEIKIKTPFE